MQFVQKATSFHSLFYHIWTLSHVVFDFWSLFYNSNIDREVKLILNQLPNSPNRLSIKNNNSKIMIMLIWSWAGMNPGGPSDGVLLYCSSWLAWCQYVQKNCQDGFKGSDQKGGKKKQNHIRHLKGLHWEVELWVNNENMMCCYIMMYAFTFDLRRKPLSLILFLFNKTFQNRRFHRRTTA